MPLIPASGGRGRRIAEFEVSLVYNVSSRLAWAIQTSSVSEKPKKEKQVSLNETLLMDAIYGSAHL